MDSFTSVVSQGQEGWNLIASAHSLGGMGRISSVSVVFPVDNLPGVEALRALSQTCGQFVVSLDPGAESPGDGGWAELLINGLTFDCTGLAPRPGDPLPERGHSFGLPPSTDFSRSQAITLMPSPHLVGGGLMFPVVRCLAWLGALLADLPDAQAVCWHGARSYNAPGHFHASVLRWIEGGAFPALGLTALVPTPEGGLASEGLALFTGQEVHLAPDLVADRAEGAKLALRLVHWLVENGRIDAPSQLAGPSGEPLLLKPQPDQQNIKVYKSS